MTEEKKEKKIKARNPPERLKFNKNGELMVQFFKFGSWFISREVDWSGVKIECEPV